MFGGTKIDEATINELCTESRGLKEMYLELLKINRRLGGRFVPIAWDVQKYIVENEYFKVYKNSSIVDLTGRIEWLKNNVSAIKIENEELWSSFSKNKIMNRAGLFDAERFKSLTPSKGVGADVSWAKTTNDCMGSKINKGERDYYSSKHEMPLNERRISIGDSIMEKVDKIKEFVLRNFLNK